LVKTKRTSGSTKKTARTSRSFAKGRIMIARVQTSGSKPNACVPRIQLQSVMARYRTLLARLNAKRHEVMHLKFKVSNLECRITELEQQLAQRLSTP